ncbi:MAG: radical SAM protein [Deltaproteobacteria bacterium]|nr:radical SAM protein [Deltaproteobacteria bacterium]
MVRSILNLSYRLITNGLKFQYLKRTGRPGSIQAVSLEITHHCIAKCIMCNIWKIPRDVQDLPMDVWLKLLSSELVSDLRELDVTGGEPFLRDDLLDLFRGIYRLRTGNLRALRSIAITTNGLLTERVLNFTEEILRIITGRGLQLVIVCAMDAIGELHDRIRNFKDAWTRVNRTVEGLTRLRERFPNLIIGLKTTILPLNVGELERIAAYADSKGLFTIISPCIITDVRYLNPDRAADLIFNQEAKEKIIGFYQGNRFQWSYHAEALINYFRTGVIRKPCTCGFNYFFVRSTGQVFLCPLVGRSPGNIQEKSPKEIIFSENARRTRRNIGRYPECRKCTEPGLERYALPYEGFSYLSLLYKMGIRNFLQLHYHMGLDKYIDVLLSKNVS